MAKILTDEVVKLVAIEGLKPGCWCPSIIISGRADGKPFRIVQDICHLDYPNERAAIGAGEHDAERRVANLLAGDPPP